MKKTISIVLVLVLGFVSVSLAVEDTWTTKSPIPTKRYALSSSVVDGKIYAMGGSSDSRTCRKVMEQYDPIIDTWTRKADMPMINGAAATSVVNGRIYVIGGISGISGTAYSSVIEYDPATDTWITKADMPTARAWVSSSVINGKIYVIGGAVIAYGAPLSTVEEYDPATDTWTRKADIPTARSCLSTSAVNGKIYAIGGSSSNPYYQGLTTVEEYDPATDTWKRKADMPTGRTYISTCAVNGKIYAVGGVRSGGADHVAPVEEYDPETDTWTTKADMPTARSGVATSAVNGKIYAIGGWIGSGMAISTVEEYDTGFTVPSPDFNGDGIVDSLDICIMIDHWGEDYPLCDIAPMPWGDGIVDVQDLILFSEHLFDDYLAMPHWKLDEEAGNIAQDSLGVHDGTLYGEPLWQPTGGIIDGALQFDGIDDYIITDFILDPSAGAFSVFAWVKGGGPGQVIISQRTVTGNIWLGLDASGGTLMTGLVPPSSGWVAKKPLVSEYVISDDNWHHIGFVWDGSYRALYVDGIEVAKDAEAQNPLKPADGGLYIGAGKTRAAGTYFSGLIDDVRIYNRVVSL